MEYSKNTVDSPNPVKRWLHRSRFASSIKLLALRPTDRILDYGCGSGELSFRISEQFPRAQIVAFDPTADLLAQAQQRLAGLPNIELTQVLDVMPGTFDRVACLEVLEHLPPTQLAAALLDIRMAIAPEGRCLFTIPIEHGVMSLAKNCYRVAAKGDRFVSLLGTARALLGLPVPRQASAALGNCSYIYSHVGFDCRAMLSTIAEFFAIEEVHVLPVGTVALGMGNGLAVVARPAG